MHPLLYEVHTRCRMREAAALQGGDLRLDSMVEGALGSWEALGLTHLWLMGLWETSPAGRAMSLRLTPPGAGDIPDLHEEEITGSAYAIGPYNAPERWGGLPSLRKARARLNARGIRLILDFIPNHTGLDHPWVAAHPERYCLAAPGDPEAFAAATSAGTQWIRHGKDPWFPAWRDTAQLNAGRRATRQALAGELLRLAACCDGVRCDMAMLLLNEVFRANWPGQAFECAGEFWREAISAVRAEFPDFQFLAEAYWDKELALQELGFDFVYHKPFYDLLVHGPGEALPPLLSGRTPRFLERSIHFLENHDEPRVASLLPLEAHRRALWILLATPGMRLLHEGQEEGRRLRASVHLCRRPLEPVDPAVREMYRDTLRLSRLSPVGRGRWEWISGEPGSLFGIEWTEPRERAAWRVYANLLETPVSPGLLRGGWQCAAASAGVGMRPMERGMALQLPGAGWAVLRRS